MDLTQRKLTKAEWDSIERPVSDDEKRVLKMIMEGYEDVGVKHNLTPSLLQYLKVAGDDVVDLHVFVTYLQPDLQKLLKKAVKKPIAYTPVAEGKKQVKKSDQMRLSNAEKKLGDKRGQIFEYVLLDLLKMTVNHREKRGTAWLQGYYTLNALLGYAVRGINRCLLGALKGILDQMNDEAVPHELVYHGSELIERNPFLLKYADLELHSHQKEIFSTIRRSNTPKLILYIAPTGTGKTLTPVGLAGGKRVIFVCAARHVGLALAKAAISCGRKVAFAFGCGDAEDIRLHYSAAKEYTKNRRTGGIFKVDNAVGDKVEIMISDIRSYVPAMLYMLAFNKAEDMVTYWDEPTITMDYDHHECHSLIQTNWRENLIPTVVLSSATLPQEDEIMETLQDFRAKFDGAEVVSIISHDCKKTIPLINKAGFVEMPHFMFSDYGELNRCSRHCERYKTLLRYVDLGEAIEFIRLVHEKFPQALVSRRYAMDLNFSKLSHVNMASIKMYYIDLLAGLDPAVWPDIHKAALAGRQRRHKSNVMVSTEDAHTLTDGPTIFLADNVDNVAKFCVQKANIPRAIIDEIMTAINYNQVVNAKIGVLEKKIEDKTAKDADAGNDRKLGDANRGDPEVKSMRRELEKLQACIKTVALRNYYVPNTYDHLKRFAPEEADKAKAYACDISEEVVEKIMLIDDVDDMWKLLLMMGIGVFTEHDSVRYAEVMKQLAQEQKLYLIIASSDFIYGTNYQFCHGYISKDLGEMSQEKAIQAMGRVGRNKLQFDYSMRFRDDGLIAKLFTRQEDKPEVRNMTRLFSS